MGLPELPVKANRNLRQFSFVWSYLMKPKFQYQTLITLTEFLKEPRAPVLNQITIANSPKDWPKTALSLISVSPQRCLQDRANQIVSWCSAVAGGFQDLQYLSPRMQQVLLDAHAKKFKKRHQIQFCWTKGSVTYLHKSKMLLPMITEWQIWVQLSNLLIYFIFLFNNWWWVMTILGKQIFPELPYVGVNCVPHHGQFNNSLQSHLPTEKSLDKLSTIYDLELFTLNTNNNSTLIYIF